MDDVLPDALHAQIASLSERGNLRMEAGFYGDAIDLWEEALRLVPQPQALWDAALWLHASIGDAFRASGEPGKAVERFRSAARCADGATNPFVLFNIGACELDLGHQDEAVDPLLRAYMLDGQDMFRDEDHKYLELLRSRKLIDV